MQAPTIRSIFRSTLVTALAACALWAPHAALAERTQVALTTDYGVITIELYDQLAPRTVANFLNLVDAEFYDGLIFHRVIANFMIQGGGYTPDFDYRSGNGPVPNESFNGVKNSRGTLAMARLQDPDSADTQFFINVKDNTHLDAAPGAPGYTVFGKVVAGMEVVEAIELVNTHLFQGMAAVPEEPVIIASIRRIN